jgi:hypothetical protein
MVVRILTGWHAKISMKCGLDNFENDQFGGLLILIFDKYHKFYEPLTKQRLRSSCMWTLEAIWPRSIKSHSWIIVL